MWKSCFLPGAYHSHSTVGLPPIHSLNICNLQVFFFFFIEILADHYIIILIKLAKTMSFWGSDFLFM